MAKPLPTQRSDLADMARIASVSAEDKGKDRWTELSLWHREDGDRPFVAVIEMIERWPGSSDVRAGRFTSYGAGTLEKAIDCFDDTLLRDALVRALPDNADTLWPDANTMRAVLASRNAFEGERLSDGLRWLYEDEEASFEDLARRFEGDFGVPREKVLGDGVAGTPWAKAFTRMLRFVSRRQFRSRKDKSDG